MSQTQELGPVARLARPLSAAWSLSLYAAAGEAGGSFQSPRRQPVVLVPGAPAADPARARAEAARRARGKVRRYCAANRLNRLGTLTYAGQGCHDPARVRADVGMFFRALRAALGGDPFAYLWVPEWHKTGHGLHVHFAVGQFVPRSVIARAWGHGFVHIKRLGGLGVGATSWDEARRAAGYLSKYVSKTFGQDLGGLHRYEVAQGFQPVVQHLTGRSADTVLALAVEVMGAEPRRCWSSLEVEGWQGPPAVHFQWA